jgi:hypothetical protein
MTWLCYTGLTLASVAGGVLWVRRPGFKNSWRNSRRSWPRETTNPTNWGTKWRTFKGTSSSRVRAWTVSVSAMISYLIDKWKSPLKFSGTTTNGSMQKLLVREKNKTDAQLDNTQYIHIHKRPPIITYIHIYKRSIICRHMKSGNIFEDTSYFEYATLRRWSPAYTRRSAVCQWSSNLNHCLMITHEQRRHGLFFSASQHPDRFWDVCSPSNGHGGSVPGGKEIRQWIIQLNSGI